MTRRRAVGVVLLLVGCAHEQPFRPGPYGPGGPYAPGTVVRLTFNPADDRDAAWMPDEAAVWYAFQRTDRRDHDFCLGLLPAGGGARLAQRCHATLDAADSTDVLEAPSAAEDGRLAYVHVTGRVGTVAPDGGELVVAPPGAGPATRVMPLPAPTPGRRSYDRAVNIRWLGRDSLVFVGELWIPQRIPLTPFYDTLRVGLGIEVLRIGDSGPVRVPGTDGATAVAAGDTAGVFYFTLAGDTRVLRLVLATGDTATVFDFGALGIARDVQLRAGRLLAVVGGAVSAAFDPNFQVTVQRDSGGPLFVVDLPAGAPVPVGDPSHRYRRPVLSSDGRTAVTEVVQLGRSDLYRISLP